MLISTNDKLSINGCIFVLVWIVHAITATSTAECGAVNITYKLTLEGVSGILKFTPNQFIVNNELYSCRWLFIYNGAYNILQPSESSTKLRQLTIKTIEPHDFGEYMSECWLPSYPVIQSNKVSIDATSLASALAMPVSSPPNTEDDVDDDDDNGDRKQQPTTTTIVSSSTTTIVILTVTLCIVLLIIAGIALVIKLRKRRLTDHKGMKHVGWSDNQNVIRSTNASLRISEHYYENEVAIQQHMSLTVSNGDCATGSTHHIHSHNTNKNIETVINVSEYPVSDPAPEMSTLYPANDNGDTGTNNTEIADLGNIYATVLPRSQRVPQLTNKTNDITTDSSLKVLNLIGQAATFRKFETCYNVSGVGDQSAPNPCTLTASNDVHMYRIMDGRVEIVEDIPLQIVDAVNYRHRETQPDKHVLCRCLSVSEGSGLDCLNGQNNALSMYYNQERAGNLVYMDIDHGERVIDIANQYDLAINLPRDPVCTYSTIDFDKKAFIAPIRRAPSSWYKRKRKHTGNC